MLRSSHAHRYVAHIWEACKQHDGHVWSVVDFRHFTVRERCFTRSQSVCLNMSEALRGGWRPRGAFLVQKNDLDLLLFSHDAAAPGAGRGREGRPPVYAAAAPRRRRAWRCVVATCCVMPRAPRRTRPRPRAAPRAPRAPARAGSRGPPPYRGGRGARAEVPAFMISGGLIKYISCVGDELTTLIAGRRRTRPRGTTTSSPGELAPALHRPLHLLRRLYSVCDDTHTQHAGRLPDLSMGSCCCCCDL